MAGEQKNGASVKTRKRAARPKSVAENTGKNGVSKEQRHRQIEEAAYLRAAARGFRGGDPTHDWLEAERELDASMR